jgi:hypothetical protein
MVCVVVVFLLYAVLICPKVSISKILGNCDGVPDCSSELGSASVVLRALYVAESDIWYLWWYSDSFE